ncbi:RDAC family protein [Lachnoclostridium phytofermentans]|uniref:Uncharacterized protein n=1 Tax=Lachnoclostridium phytofermentans (strain ATCC 700394 / DSM 18823 / ISDg) TaxID=357809 RepID=A9KMR4_LACP7|nr:hypothetical protein [Lachnoclostridium phytofermentans]ABX41509.1 hypothetical protein Cphy_1131 [Lachnoclostridium phytofermentans ISDg]
MKYISIAEVLTLNQKIKEADLPYQIHLRDACGKQSLWIEDLNDDKNDQKRRILEELLAEYFHSLHFILEFSEDRMNFWISAN